jgi:hypothetical protein
LRIERIHVEGYGPLSGVFHFPPEGVGLWATPNESGKSALASAIVDALYGSPPGARPLGPDARITAELTQSNGESLIVTRELSSGTLRVTTSDGLDVTSRFTDEDPAGDLGSTLLGLTRPQFEETAILRFDDLRKTIGNGTLLTLLRLGKHGAPAACATTAETDPMGPTERPPEPPTPAEALELSPEIPAPPRKLSSSDMGEDDLEIVHSSDEMGVPEAAKSPAPPSESQRIQIEAHDETPLTFVDPDEPGIEPAERLRRMRDGIAVLARRLELKSAELQSNSERLLEIQSEAERLAMLTGAEPRDMESLRELLETLQTAQERKEQIRIEEARYQRELEEGKVSVERILELDRIFEPTDDRERNFLDSYRQEETIRRGNLALIRSESRLEDNRLEEIAQKRHAKQRIALVPLIVSVVCLFGSIFLYFLPLIPWSWTGLLTCGLGSAFVGAATLWTARHLHERERRELQTILERKLAQVEELEKEGKYRAGRLFVIAEERSFSDENALLEAFAEWRRYLSEIRELERLKEEHHKVGLEIVKLHEKLGAFRVAQDAGADPWNSGNTESLYRDYSRFFETRDELESAEADAHRAEHELSAIEVDKSNLHQRLQAILEGAGIDPERDLDEAIEMYARRAAEGQVPPIELTDLSVSMTPSSGTPGEPAATDSAIDSWCSAVSARTEAILRRFHPETRDVEVDSQLGLSLRLDPEGPRVEMKDLAEYISTSSVDQVCLALRLAIVETLSASGEGFPLLLDDPLIRLDDARHDRALDFLVSDCGTRIQVVLLTAQAVRSRWCLHQYPNLRDRVASILEQETTQEDSTSSASPASSPLF